MSTYMKVRNNTACTSPLCSLLELHSAVVLSIKASRGMVFCTSVLSNMVRGKRLLSSSNFVIAETHHLE